MIKEIETVPCREVLVHEPDSFVAAYVEHPGDYTWHEALEIAKERDQEAADQLRLDALADV